MNSLKQYDELILMTTHSGFLSNISCICIQSQVPTNNIKENTTILNQLERIINDSEIKMLQETLEEKKKKKTPVQLEF